MSQQIAERDIRQKHQELERAGADFGPASGGVQSAGSGGFFQVYENTRIYWHASTGAHEVHGAILKKYLELGGPGANPLTGRRDFGFPNSDQTRSLFFAAPVSQFEFGTVHHVRGFESVGVYGPLASQHAPSDGLPLSEPVSLPHGEVLYCQDACLYLPTGVDKVVRASYRFPELGRPALITPDSAQKLLVGVSFSIDEALWDELLAAVSNVPLAAKKDQVLKRLLGIWDGRLSLQSVRHKSVRISLSPRVEKVVENPGNIVDEPGIRPTNVIVESSFRVEDGAQIPDRTLFNLALNISDNKSYPLAPHALYTRRTWDSFRFIHATDLHVTRRVESFRATLKTAGRDHSARVMVNPNDSIRALINFANKLHDKGDVDFLLVTGDLVDYAFEGGDDRRGGGNFVYLERLLLGEAPSGDDEGVENQELHVPIFTLLGNHDYVVNPYELFFSVDTLGENPKIRKYEAFNLNQDDAVILQNGKRLTLSTGAALKMVESSRDATAYYRQRINSQGSYIVNLGADHRIIMLDTGPNKDVIESEGDAVEEYLGFSNEDEKSFVRGTPNSAGSASGLALLRKGLASGLPPGVVVVGMHNPPLNTLGNEYPHFFRESERPHLDEKRLESLVKSFLSRQAGVDGPRLHDSWSRKRTAHFKQGGIEDLLDHGIVKWSGVDVEEFLRLCTRHKVDVVLCGHIHERVEFRIQPDGGSGFLFFTDFYTENPRESRASYDWQAVAIPGFPAKDPGMPSGDTRPIHIQVDPGASAGEAVREVRDQRQDNVIIRFRRLRVPPYPDPLKQAGDKADWWARHRPLILQTACVGPIDRFQRGLFDSSKLPDLVGELLDLDLDVSSGQQIARRAHASFQGVRLFSVQKNEIARIDFVSIVDIRGGAAPFFGLDSVKDLAKDVLSAIKPAVTSKPAVSSESGELDQ